MEIGGFQKTSLIDYPDHICSIIWTSRCNFRCPFCYNPDLVFGRAPLIQEEEVFNHLKKRKNVIDALTITGGEPTLQKDLGQFIKKVKGFGYLVKLDTNGTNPKALRELLDNNLLDYIAMDVKAPKEKYALLTGIKPNLENIEDSIKIIQEKAPDYEFRTTVIPNLLEKKDILEIAKWLSGSRRYVLQQFTKPSGLVDKKAEELKPYPDKFFEELSEKLKKNFNNFQTRGVK